MANQPGDALVAAIQSGQLTLPQLFQNLSAPMATFNQVLGLPISALNSVLAQLVPPANPAPEQPAQPAPAGQTPTASDQTGMFKQVLEISPVPGQNSVQNNPDYRNLTKPTTPGAGNFAAGVFPVPPAGVESNLVTRRTTIVTQFRAL
jgi:hypothetical protein